MSGCQWCRAGKPRLKLQDGKYVADESGRIHVLGVPGKYAELVSCTRELRECGHDYEIMPHCSGRVCLNCGDHPGKNKCQACGWKRGEDLLPGLEHAPHVTLKDIIIGDLTS